MPRRAGWPGSLVSRTLLRSVCADSFGPSSRGRMSELWVGPAQSSDLVAVAAVYDHWLRTSTATFDVMQPRLSWWQAKLDSTAAGDHFLVVRDDDAVLGFANCGAFRTRPAYALTRETSVYLARQAMGRGAGSRLYSELLWLLRHDRAISSWLSWLSRIRPVMPCIVPRALPRSARWTRSGSTSAHLSAPRGADCA